MANRSLAADWPGSNLHFEGALLSFAAGQTDFARSRLRSAAEWLKAWVRRLDDDDPHRHHVTAADIAEVAFGLLNTEGVEACAGWAITGTDEHAATAWGGPRHDCDLLWSGSAVSGRVRLGM